jgi:hypothetical protein
MSQQPLPKTSIKQPLPRTMTAADYLRWIELARPNEKEYEQIRVVARSPSSPAGLLLMSNLDVFAQKGFSVRAVFTGIRSKSDVDNTLAEYDSAFGQGQANSCVRFSNFKRNRMVRELMDIGKTAARLCGAATSLNSLEVTSTVGDSDTDFTRKFAFDAIWEISSAACR